MFMCHTQQLLTYRHLVPFRASTDDEKKKAGEEGEEDDTVEEPIKRKRGRPRKRTHSEMEQDEDEKQNEEQKSPTLVAVSKKKKSIVSEIVEKVTKEKLDDILGEDAKALEEYDDEADEVDEEGKKTVKKSSIEKIDPYSPDFSVAKFATWIKDGKKSEKGKKFALYVLCSEISKKLWYHCVFS